MLNSKLKNGLAALAVAAVCVMNVSLQYVPEQNDTSGVADVVYESSVYDADGATYAATPAVILTARAAALVTKAAVRSAVAYTLVCSFCGNEPQEEIAQTIHVERDMRLAQLN
ncbi:hypothetical protein ABWH96_11345 [Marivirga tractuosa]|uniref:hypothetical protein n=1 Tax=Marivirga tractuosa TaxID=1006 RepID=UPI0035D120FB